MKARRGLCPTCGREVALAAIYVRQVGKVRAEHGQARNHQPPTDAKPGSFYALRSGRRFCNGGLARPLSAVPA